MAPEQRDTRDKVWYLSGPSGRLSSYTNIWAIGATMYELLTLHRFRKALHSGGEIRTDRTPEYTDTLRHLVRSCLRPNPQDRPDIPQLLEIIRHSRSQFKLEGSRLRGEDQSVPHETERLYYSGKEIETMEPGRWQPTNPDLMEKDESGFRDPRYSTLKFPNWGGVRKTHDEDKDESSSSDGERATRRVLAGHTGDFAQVAGPAVWDRDDELDLQTEGETGSLGGEMTSKAPELWGYQPPSRNTWERMDEATMSEEGMQRMRANR